MLDDNELLFDELYEKTKDCGRVQFINLLMGKEREKQELIDYLKEKIKLCDKNIEIHKKEIAGVVNISENNRHILLIKRFKVEKQIYEEILSKIEKSDK